MRDLPSATVARLPIYLRTLNQLLADRVEVVSSNDLATLVGIGPALVRRDLSLFGTHGTRGVGYEVVDLATQITALLGAEREWSVVLVGAGSLGQAIARHLSHRGFQLVAATDTSPQVIGTRVAGVVVSDGADLAGVLAENPAEIGIIAVPAEAAQDACDALVAAGVTSILNLAPAVLVHPDHVAVRTADIALELQVLAYHRANLEGAEA